MKTKTVWRDDFKICENDVCKKLICLTCEAPTIDDCYKCCANNVNLSAESAKVCDLCLSMVCGECLHMQFELSPKQQQPLNCKKGFCVAKVAL